MYRDSKEEETAIKKLYKLKQTASAIMYTTEFQSLLIQVDWNEKALMAQYKKELKSKGLDTLVMVEDLKGIKDLINKVVKINNRIY